MHLPRFKKRFQLAVTEFILQKRYEAVCKDQNFSKMIAIGNTSPVLFRLPVCGFLLQRGHRLVKDKPHGMIPFDLHP
jgi:hypothetical protein